MSIVIESVQVIKKSDYDVIVAGAGIAGIAAAIAARRRGHKVLLIEKTINLGGLATNGLVTYFNPSLCDRRGRRIIGGIAEELLHLSVKYGCGTLSPEWTYRKVKVENDAVYHTQFSAPNFIAALDELVCDTGIDLLLDTLCCNVFMENGLCKGVFMENKEGRVFFGCKQLIDTTGDLDLFKRAGAPCVEGLNWLSCWALSVSMDKIKKCIKNNDIQDALIVNMLGADRTNTNNAPDMRRYSLGSGEEVTEFILRGRRYVLDFLKKMDIKNEMITTLPSQAQYRTTRYINADYILTNEDMDKTHEDSIGCAYRAHNIGFFMEIPYRTMVLNDYPNMITAGRTIASIDLACELTRLIAPGAVTGEAAGIAASIAIEKNYKIASVPVDILQREIVAAGGIIHYK